MAKAAHERWRPSTMGVGGYGGGGTASHTRMSEVVQGLYVKTPAGANGNEQAASVVSVRQTR
jgi:hypothetical protein